VQRAQLLDAVEKNAHAARELAALKKGRLESLAL
jgi:hypothetical protein